MALVNHTTFPSAIGAASKLELIELDAVQDFSMTKAEASLPTACGEDAFATETPVIILRIRGRPMPCTRSPMQRKPSTEKRRFLDGFRMVPPSCKSADKYPRVRRFSGRYEHVQATVNRNCLQEKQPGLDLSRTVDQ